MSRACVLFVGNTSAEAEAYAKEKGMEHVAFCIGTDMLPEVIEGLRMIDAVFVGGCESEIEDVTLSKMLDNIVITVSPHRTLLFDLHERGL